MNTKYIAFIALLLCGNAQSSEVIDIFEYQSTVDGKKILSRPSPEFIKRAGNWKPGDTLSLDMAKLRSDAALKMKESTAKEWQFHNMSLNRFDSDETWFFSIMLKTTNGDFAIILANLRGDLWTWDEYYNRDGEGRKK